MTFKQLSLKIAAVGTAATLGLGALPALGAPPTSTDLPRSVGELMNMSPMDVMHMMDTEHKGKVTKKQYMKFFSDLWDKMEKDQSGMVSMEAFTTGWAARHK
jgi:hypothetical protein